VNHPKPKTDYPELVEGLLFLQAVMRDARSKEQPFDKLREVGLRELVNQKFRGPK
jgi:hypothetical protein